MTQIAERAGVGIGTVYHHFPTLDDTINACAAHVTATYPSPSEAIFAGVPTMKERLVRLARALFEYQDKIGLDVVRQDRDRVAMIRKVAEDEQALRTELTRAALAPFAIDRDLIRISAALLDIGVCRALQQSGLTLDEAAETIATVIQTRLTHKG